MAKNQQFKYDLTIGMIVKNEEKYLERCLLALEPLRQQIDCELIITDTGSTDRTVEIAKNYADTFLTFEWCNDFAAARNQGLSRAKGHWFMFVDADEIADEETIDKLIQFMKSDTRDTYDNATVDIINYKDKKEIDFDLLVASRLTNLEKREQKFTGALHENLHWTDNSFAIQTKFYHYGYTDAMKPKKLVRNQEILDIMMEETPNVMHIHQANINNQTDVFKKIALCEETMKLAEEKKMDDNETHFVSMQLVRCYHFVDRFDDFEALLDKYLTNETRDILPKLEILYAAAFTYGIENSTEKKVKYYKAYLEMYQALESKPDTVYMGMCPYFSNTQEKFVETSFLLASHYLEQEDLAMVNQLLNDINFKRYEEVFDNPSRKMEYMALAMRSKSEDLILRLYEYIKQNKKEEQILAFIDSLNDIYYTIANDKKMIFHSSFSGEEDTFSAINSLREVEYDFSKCTSKTLELLDDDRLAYETLLYADAFYATILYKKDTLQFYKKSTYSFLKSLIDLFCEKRGEFLDTIYDKIENGTTWYSEYTSYFEKMVYAYLYFACFVKQAALVNEAQMKEDEKITKQMIRKCNRFFEAYVETTVLYMQEVYTADMLKNEMVSVLSGVEAFAFFMKDMIGKREVDFDSYAKTLQDTLKYLPKLPLTKEELWKILEMKPEDEEDEDEAVEDEAVEDEAVEDAEDEAVENIDLILENEIVEEPPLSDADLIEALTKQTKSMLRAFINTGDVANAKMFFSELKALLPQDGTLLSLQKEIETM